MNALIRKEIRLLLPAWIAAVALAMMSVWSSALGLFEPSGLDFAGFLFAFLLLCLAPFGQEFNAGTFQQILSQPVARKRLWRIKAALLAAAMASILLIGIIYLLLRLRVFQVGYPKQWEIMLMRSGCFVAAVFAGGLWTTLFFRQIAAAFWFTILTPALIFVSTLVLAEKLLLPPLESPVPQNWAYAALLVYSLAGYFWARRMFLRAQDTQWTGGTISLPNWLSVEPTVASAPTHKPFRALFWKELQAQQVTLLLSAILLVLHLVAIGLRKAPFVQFSTEKMLPQLLRFWWSLWFAMPLLVGSAAVAEERKYGTLESQLCLPTTRRLQFGLKCGVALLLGIFLGSLLPWLLEWLGGLIGFPSDFSHNRRESWQSDVPHFLIISFGITFISFYASTLTRNLFQAMGAALLVGIVVVGYANWAAIGGPIGHFTYLWFGSPLVYVGLVLLAAVMLRLGFENYTSLLVGWKNWLRNSVAVFASLAVIVLCTTLVFNRAWEWILPLEPGHGPARLSGPVQPQILTVGRSIGKMSDGGLAVGHRVFSLLPDGRVWVSSVHGFRKSNVPGDAEMPRMPFPVKGAWVSGTNWVNVACDAMHVFGIQSDGTLWKLYSASATNIEETLSAVPVPERIGTDADWKSIVAGEMHFLLLKTNGTLWGWGRNHEGQLGAGPDQVSNDWARVGRDSDWFSIFASGNTSVGVKQDGSVWKWGYLPVNPTGATPGWKTWPHPEPMQFWKSQGTDWRQYISLGSIDEILKNNGSLLVVAAGGNLYSEFNRRYGMAHRGVEIARDLKAISNNGATLVRLTRNGVLLRGTRYEPNLISWGSIWRPSRYSDWIAIQSDVWGPCLALAADGTLCCWPDVHLYQYRYAGSWLGPSRRPLWSVNLLTELSGSK